MVKRYKLTALDVPAIQAADCHDTGDKLCPSDILP